MQNHLVHFLAFFPLSIVIRSGHAAPPVFRQLATDEIKIAIAIKQVSCNWSMAPWLKPGLSLPAGVALEPEGYFCIASDDKYDYDFVEAQAPRGKEVVFACKKMASPMPFLRWITEPASCRMAIAEPPRSRAAQVESAARLGLDDMDVALEAAETLEGRAYHKSFVPLFESVLQQCSRFAPANPAGYAWVGRVSTKGKVARSGMDVTTMYGDRLHEASPYATCILSGAKQYKLPLPPIGSGSHYLGGGWPIAIRWKHDKTGDKIKD